MLIFIEVLKEYIDEKIKGPPEGDGRERWDYENNLERLELEMNQAFFRMTRNVGC